MDNVKMPFIPEEVLKIQRVEIYLNDLKERLNELRTQHDEVIHSSVEMIKEIDEVSSTLLSTSSSCGEHMTKIKKLIMEFESANESFSKQTSVVLETDINVRKVLENFEKLNESHHLKESLTFLRKARESLEKIDTYLEVGLVDLKRINVSEGIREKINMFNTKERQYAELTEKTSLYAENNPPRRLSQMPINQVMPRQNDNKNVLPNDPLDSNSRDKLETISNYASCCSSLASLSLCRNSLNGYEGDNDDSEFDIIAAKKNTNPKLN